MLKATFEKNHSLYIPFIMGGYPTRKISKDALITLSQQGADIIELGVPFSDPVADGPVNQKAATTAIANGMHLDEVLSMVQEVREAGTQTPIMLFSYLNPLLNAGIPAFCKKAKAVGVDGVLIVDLPPEEGVEIFKQIRGSGLELALLVSPTTNPNRFLLYEVINPSFIYYISRQSVTGAKDDLSMTLESELRALRQHFPSIAIAAGFGISNYSQAKAVAQMADGVIIGSILGSTLADYGFDGFVRLSNELSEIIHQESRTLSTAI
jgi:tryptophan synthase alpha subunit